MAHPRLSLTCLLTAAILLLPALGAPAGADMCAADQVPAATLLAPYFEVDLNSEIGTSTILSIQNTWPESTLVQVTFWTDWSQPTIFFPVFLTGFDVVTLNLRDVFTAGNLPITADDQTDPTDSISPHGTHPEWDGSFDQCDLFFPYNNPAISGANFDLLVNGHVGGPVAIFGDECMGSVQEDGIARGYVTIDDISRCDLTMPHEPGYFDGDSPVATLDNQLIGDFYIIDPNAGTAVGAPLVHVEADPSFDPGSTASGMTFYGRYTGPTGDDHREPLGAVWGVPYRDVPGIGRSTDWVVWRDSSADDTASSYTCGTGPDWLELPTPPVICWDEEESLSETCAGEACFPFETQRVTVGAGVLQPGFASGWCRLDLSIDDDGVTGDLDFPAAGGTVAQGWVGALETTDGAFQGGFAAVQLESACAVPPQLTPTFSDGFESGDTSRWSSTVP